MLVTVFTPTYNRAYTLQRCYESLRKQTYKNFEWIIVDDGSIDNTSEMVASWISNNEVNINYYRQENSGKQVAHNRGAELAKGELFTCLDSDDWLVDNALELIVYKWKKRNESNHNVAGIIALDSDKNGALIGDCWAESLTLISPFELLYQYKVRGDKCYIFKTELLKKFPFPELYNEKHMPPSYQLMNMSYNYKMILMPTVLKIVEYLDDGITKNIKRKYLIAPNNYADFRLLMIRLPLSFNQKFKQIIHYVSSCLLARRKIYNKDINLFYFLAAMPLGYMLYFYLKYLNKPRNL